MPDLPSNIAVTDPQTLAWVLRQCHRVSSFRIEGPGVTFHRGERSMSCRINPPAGRRGAGVDTFPAVLTAVALATGHDFRWKYTFAEVAFSLDGSDNLTVAVVPEASGGRAGVAWNLAELTHTAEPGGATPSYVFGVDIHGDAYGDSDFGPRPVGGGGTDTAFKLNQVVDLAQRRITHNDEAVTIYTFDRPGTHDGDCGEAE